MKAIEEKAGGQNIAAGDVGLQLGEIAEAEDVGVVLAGREIGEDEVVVLAVESVVEPDSSFLDGAGEGEARKELVETPSMLVLDGRDEVRGEEAEVIVSDSGVEIENAAGAFAVLRGLARGFDVDGAEGVGANVDDELSVGGLSDVESVELGDGLVRLRSGDVRLRLESILTSAA